MKLEDVRVGSLYKYEPYTNSKYKYKFLVKVIDKGYENITDSPNEDAYVVFLDPEPDPMADSPKMLTMSPSCLDPYEFKTYCWKCKKDLDSSIMKLCHKCERIICPDDSACLCGFNRFAK